MSTLRPANPSFAARYPGAEWVARREPAEWHRGYARPGPGPGLLLAGLAVVGLGALAWYTMGPDLIRYIKMERM